MATVIPRSSRRFGPRGAAVAELLTERIAAEVATAQARPRDDLRRHPLPTRR
ncbi:hypothetical protein [Actinomycetospora callitridis]|uniref:hypothetical protein n=1 Tax=Actinomycetospora callitridis TaxID=913944 RepID=UPI0023654FF5|nr:hypothetical protein [Actinomycetospora callitridis]MDD7919338.1 hypothetical protein [Actinomycetospora callitridis]